MRDNPQRAGGPRCQSADRDTLYHHHGHLLRSQSHEPSLLLYYPVEERTGPACHSSGCGLWKRAWHMLMLTDAPLARGLMGVHRWVGCGGDVRGDADLRDEGRVNGGSFVAAFEGCCSPKRHLQRLLVRVIASVNDESQSCLISRSRSKKARP